jgi:DNA end-binding protein Ku
MRAMWKGSISFGLVNIPVRMFSAIENQDVTFRQLHQDCHHPVRYRKFCPVCEREIGNDEIVRGFEYAKGQYIVLRDEDLERLPLPTLHTIEIIHFVDVVSVDPIYYENTYYLSPGDYGEKPYKLLYAAMQKTNKAAVAKMAFRTKEHLCLIRFYERCLSMSLLHFPSEIRSTAGIPVPIETIPVKEAELDMAVALIHQLSSEFKPDLYHSDYREALKGLIEAKAGEQELVTPPHTAKANIVDLMDALRASLEAAARATGTGVRGNTGPAPTGTPDPALHEFGAHGNDLPVHRSSTSPTH